jgi:hypothetical protein
VLDPVWLALREPLPSHVQEVLGPKKNVLLLREILVSASYHDESLVDDLARGFPLIGKLPRSGTLPSVPYPPTPETRESLLDQVGQRNDEILHRVMAWSVVDVEIALEVDKKGAAEVTAGKACEVPLATVVASCVLSPRFPVGEGWKEVQGRHLGPQNTLH